MIHWSSRGDLPAQPSSDCPSDDDDDDDATLDGNDLDTEKQQSTVVATTEDGMREHSEVQTPNFVDTWRRPVF